MNIALSPLQVLLLLVLVNTIVAVAAIAIVQTDSVTNEPTASTIALTVGVHTTRTMKGTRKAKR